MRGLLLAAFVEAGIIAWRDLSKEKVLPLPSDFVAVAIYFGGLGLLPSSASGVASALGWGMVVATFLNLFDPTNPTALIFPGQAQQFKPNPNPSGTQGAPYTGGTVTSTVQTPTGNVPVTLGQGTSVAGGGTNALHG